MKKLIVTIFAGLFISGFTSGKITPTLLTCEYMINPQVVDIQQPRLSWIDVAEKGERGQAQLYYQIRVATSVDKLKNPDLWNSQKVQSNQSTRIAYSGKTLTSRMECWWQVRVWDKDNKVSGWSAPSFWRMGILKPEEWKAKWIGAPWEGEEHFKRPSYPGQKIADFGPPAPMLRKSFILTKKISKAVAYVTGLGYFELYANGKKVGNDVLVPNMTNYSKRPLLGTMSINVEDNFRDYKVLYLAYDITSLLSGGENVLGAILGNGFYNPQMYWCEGYGTTRFLAQLEIIYSDGTREKVVSDESWKVARSPILKNMVYYGETYDARLEQPGWCSAGFDDSGWEKASLRKAPYGRLAAHTSPPDKVMEQFKPVAIKKLDNGNYFVDFGKEISGWVRLINISAPAGHKIDISFNANQYSGDNTYIFKGTGLENYAPRFNWFVFSGVEIKNWYGELKPEQIVAEAVYTDVGESAEFETSNTLFNQINEIWKRSQKDNMHGGLASDCPHRERSGYTGDGQVACVTVMHNFDSKAFYQKWISDMRDAQNPETGYVPNGAPWQPGCGGGVAWGAAICIMPWEFYLHTGSLDILSDNFLAMKEYIRYMNTWVDTEGIMFMERTGNDGKILKWYNLGEWVAPGNLPPDDMVHTFYYWRCADITAQVAKVLNDQGDFLRYSELAERTRKAFQNRYYNEKEGTYGKAGGNIFALRMGVPANQYGKVVEALKNDIKDNKGHLDTGIFGTQFFFEVLSDNGLHELAFEAMNKKDKPGYGYWLELGSTTSREQWDEGGSHNHPMFGGGLTWFYRKLAGMQVDPENPGYRHIIFRPQPAGDLTFVSYFNETSYGRAGITWVIENNLLLVDVTVPVGCTAKLFIPLMTNRKITEGPGKTEYPGSHSITDGEEGYRIVEIPSGIYHFVSS